jgi:hypothetical protein
LTDQIRTRLTAERREKAFKAYLDGVWARGNVKLDEQALAALGQGKTDK